MSSSSGICRVCGSSKLDQDLISDINSVEGANLKLSDYIRVNLSNDLNLPTKVCRVCRMHIETFIAFCDNLNKVEMKFTNASDKINKEETGALVKMEDSTAIVQKEQSSLQEVKSEPGLSQSRSFRGGKSPIQNIIHLFEEPLKRPFSENESHAHITVDMTNVSAEGEISTAWLASFGVATWMDIVYNCLHCKKTGGIKSLIALLNHRKNESVEKTKIQCTECDRQYSALNSYINHVTKIHHEHLSFCCIECGKIHFNVAALINHYNREHPTIMNIYPCIECGYYAQSFTQLKIHVLSHKTQEVSDSEDEEPQAKLKRSELPGPSSTSTPLRSLKNYHPKAFSGSRNKQEGNNDPGKNRKTFPCDKCDRVLLTHQGWVYHQLVHSNSKPFGCRTCPAAFRSKQACDDHEKAH